jgi:asparagine synthase (glutamine-hydrolysing)
MPGLAGIAGKGLPDVKESVCRMGSSLGLGTTPSALQQVAAPGIAMAADSQPAGLWGSRVAVDDKDSAVGINGEVFGLLDDGGNTTEDFIRGPDSNPAMDILRLYRQQGLDFIRNLRGYFSLAIWDGQNELLHLAADRFALRQLFYYRHGKHILFGSEVKAILTGCAILPESDEHGIADFLLLGMPLADRTFFKDIKLVPPASIVTIGFNQLHVKQYWHLRFKHEYDGLADPETATERLSEALEAAIYDCVDGPTELELPLSGGLDSRCIGAIASKKSRLRSYTMGGNESQDLQVGPLVASRLGFSNETCPLTAQDFIDWIPESIYITDGMYSPVNAPILALARKFSPDAKVVLDGANSFDGYYKAYQILMQRIIPRRYTALEMAKGTVDQPVVDSRLRILKPLFSMEFLSESRRHLQATSNDIEASLEAGKPGNHFDSMDFLDLSNRTRRFNMMGTVLLRAFCEVRQPLFDHRIVDLVTQLPLIFRSKEKLLMARCLQKLDPYLASLPYERTGLPANAGLSRQLAEYVKRGILKSASHAFPGLREKPRVSIDYMHWIRNDLKLQGYLKSVLLDPQSLSRNHIEGSRVEPFMIDLFAGRSENLFLIMRLLSLELWYRFFIEGESSPAFHQTIPSMTRAETHAPPEISYRNRQQRRDAQQKN